MRSTFALIPIAAAVTAGSPAQAQVALESLQAQILSLQQELAALKANSALKLDGKVGVDIDPNGYPRVLFSGVNVQVNSGHPTVPGTGSVIIGFNEPRHPGAAPVCPDRNYPDEASCKARGNVRSINHKSGRDNLIVGKGHAYSAYGSILDGLENAASGAYAVVGGGRARKAEGEIDWRAGELLQDQ